ncbi:MAG: flippase [Desulfobacteraceae bacterium]|nr:MAG: flippase [Desulfobacteraceae bacterium]
MPNYLPLFLRQHIENRPRLQKIIFNTGWLTLERVTRLGIGLLISVLVARHLGPEHFGILSYTLSIIAFLSTFVYLGLNGLVVRDIVRLPEEKEILLGTTFSLKFAGSMFAFIIIIAFSLLTRGTRDEEFWVLLVIGLSLFASPFETIDLWFQSQVQSKFSVIAKSSAFLLAGALKALLVFLGASVIGIAVAYSLESVIAAILLVFIYHFKGFSVCNWNTRSAKAKELLNQSWILILSGFFSIINLRVDQVMLRWMSSAMEVGVYSVAVTFSEVWYFIPTAIVMSAYPRLVELKKTKTSEYDKRLQQIFDVLFTVSLLIALAVTFIARPLIPFLYTDAYSSSASILIIHVWAGVFMFMRALFSKWVFLEDALIFSLISHCTGAAVNVSINFFLIPRFGGQGAAIATLISYAASSYFFLFFYSKTRPLAVKMTRSFILPFRIIIYKGKVWI